MGWWTDKAFSQPAPSKKKVDRQYAKAIQNNKCPVCKKPWTKCGHTSVTYSYKPVKEKVKVKDKNDKERTVTRNAGYKVDDKGVNWCSTCNMRVHNGKCMNVTCSTRR